MSDTNGDNKKMKSTEMKRVLVYGGKTGWIGNLMVEMIEKEGMYGFRDKNGHFSEIRLGS